MRRASLCAAFLAAAWPGAARAQVYVEEDQDFSNSAFVRVSDEVNAELFLARARTEEQSWAAAVNAYQRILDREDDAVVEFGPRVYLSAAEAARRRLGELPAEALSAYEGLFGARAEAARRQALCQFDAALLLRVAARYPFTGAARRALEEACALACESGASARAAAAAGLLLDRGWARAADVGRLAGALADLGDRRGLAELRARATALLAEPLRSGGVERPLGALLDELEARLGAHAAGEERRRLCQEKLRVEVLARLPFEERARMPSRDHDPLDAPQLSFPPHAAAAAAGRVWVLGLLGLYRFDGTTGGDAPLVLYEREFGHDPNYAEINSRSLEPANDGRNLYFALNESSLTFRTPPDEVSQLIGIDAAEDGRCALLLRAQMQGTPEEFKDFVFEGPPVPCGDLLLVAGSRLRASTECALFAFERASGRLVWSRFLASASKVSRYDSRLRMVAEERVAPSPLAVAGGVAYCVTNLGIVAAVDVLSGSIVWLFKYNRVRSVDLDAYRRESYYDTGGWFRSPPYVVGDQVVAAPEDSRFLYVLARRPSPEGHLLLRPSFKEGRRALLGVEPEQGLLVFGGESGLGPTLGCLEICASDLAGSRVRKTPAFETEERMSGKPLLLERTLFLPTNKALYRIALDQDLLIKDHLPVPEPLARLGEEQVFGNVFLLGDALVSVSPAYVLRVCAAR
ncbi:MAG: hypothetical protein HY812_07575 [Planctomycetes bacterium]|nr:hypothetical protein [Planctomycetota bacterium]